MRSMAHPTPTTTPTTTPETTPPTFDVGSTGDGEIHKALAALVDDVERGFNTNDAELMVSPFTDDAWAVGVTGTVHSGREEMVEVSRQLLAGPLHDQHAAYQLADVRLLRSDVAIARKLARVADPERGTVELAPSMVALYVFAKEDGRWRVAARQNTLIGAPT